ncbi:MAG: hypothetical protein ACFCVK_01160 [Acidimicrobiales bacterium]
MPPSTLAPLLATATHTNSSDLRQLLGAGCPLRLVGASRNTGA